MKDKEVYKLLDRIDSPADVKALSIEEMESLCHEIRRHIIEVISSRGGHLASSLGCVETTVALHYVFDAPRDKILWDVGHQSYAHKIITGRRERFADIRTMKGISGFPSITESEYDTFGVGHASTAISAALGFAVARDQAGEDHYVVSVVGDGALTGGMSFEGINQAGHLKKNRFIIVLNDNEMSISKNVGALSRYLTKITTKKLYLQLEADVWELLGRIPSVGGKAKSLARRIKESIKNLVVPNILFEELGFRYFGPLDGHDISQLIESFEQLKQVPGPILVHVVTKKGKGYSFAEENAERFHGVSSFYKTTGNSRANSRKQTYSSVFGAAMIELAEGDEKVVAITAAMKEGTGLAAFGERFPERFFDVGIAEQHAVTFAAGLARAGMKPFVAIYSTFLQRCYDQIIHDVALQRLPVRFILDRAGLVGEDGPTHHGAFDISYLRVVPGLAIMAPSDAAEFRRMIAEALSYEEGPIAIRFPRGAAPDADPSPRYGAIEMGRGVLLREGPDVTVIAVGSMVSAAREAVDIAASRGIAAALVDARFIKPLDHDMISSVASNGSPVVTLEENALNGGFGEAITELLTRAGFGNRVVRIGLPDRFVPHGRREELLAESGLDAESVAAQIIRIHEAQTTADSGGVT